MRPVYDAPARRPTLRDRRIAIALAIGIAAVASAVAVAQPDPHPSPAKVTVALLPLDAEARLALYGQPVAAAISTALAAEGVDVAVVGQGDPVPTRAVLVIDGRIDKKGKGVVLALRIRDPARAEVLAEVSATAAKMTAIDKAAHDAATKLIPEVRTQLAAVAERNARDHAAGSGTAATGSGMATGSGTTAGSGPATGSGAGTGTRGKPVVVQPAILLVATSRVALDGRPDAMVAAIAPAFERLIGASDHRVVPPSGAVVDGDGGLAAAARTAGAELAISVDVLSLKVETGKVPYGKLRARIRIVAAAGGAPLFDRVVKTDTVVGGVGEVARDIAGYAGAQLADVMRVRVMKAVGGAK